MNKIIFGIFALGISLSTISASAHVTVKPVIRFTTFATFEFAGVVD